MIDIFETWLDDVCLIVGDTKDSLLLLAINPIMEDGDDEGCED